MTDALAVKYISGLSVDNTERSVDEIAKTLQMEPDEVNEMTTNVYAAYWHQTAKQINQESGLDGAEVLKVISEVLTPRERSSLMHRVYLGDKSVIQDIISKYC